MCRRIGFALLCLLALPFLAAAQPPPPPSILPGLVRIDLDPRTVSFLPLYAETLSDGLCAGDLATSWPGMLSPRGECDVSVSTPTNMDLYTLGNVAGAGTQRVGVQPVSPATWYASAPVATPCGFWQVSMRLDPGKRQPVSSLDLEAPDLTPPGASPAQGVFAGVVKLAVRYLFVNPDKGTSLELPAVVSLELSGHWTTLPDSTVFEPRRRRQQSPVVRRGRRRRVVQRSHLRDVGRRALLRLSHLAIATDRVAAAR